MRRSAMVAMLLLSGACMRAEDAPEAPGPHQGHSDGAGSARQPARRLRDRRGIAWNRGQSADRILDSDPRLAAAAHGSKRARNRHPRPESRCRLCLCHVAAVCAARREDRHHRFLGRRCQQPRGRRAADDAPLRCGRKNLRASPGAAGGGRLLGQRQRKHQAVQPPNHGAGAAGSDGGARNHRSADGSGRASRCC